MESFAKHIKDRAGEEGGSGFPARRIGRAKTYLCNNIGGADGGSF